MKEEVRFVWEEEINVDLVKARKERVYKDMKERMQKIEETIKKLEEIEKLAEFADDYGVLDVDVWMYYSGDVVFENGSLFIVYGNIKEELGEIFNVEEIDEFKNMVKRDWRSVIGKIIEWEKEQKKIMEEYMEEANDYLVVKVVKDYDEEDYEDDYE